MCRVGDAVKVLIPDRGYSRWSITEILQVIEHDQLKGKDPYPAFEGVYLHDEEALRKLEKLLEEYDALVVRWDEVLGTMTRVYRQQPRSVRKKG